MRGETQDREWAETFPHMAMGGCSPKQGEWKLDVNDKSRYKNKKTQKRGYD